MATVRGGKITLSVKGAGISVITFSGTVKLATVGVVRDMKCYKVGAPETVFETTSDSSGNWSLTVPGGSHDRFRIIAVGISGENSQIFDHLSG